MICISKRKNELTSNQRTVTVYNIMQIQRHCRHHDFLQAIDSAQEGFVLKVQRAEITCLSWSVVVQKPPSTSRRVSNVSPRDRECGRSMIAKVTTVTISAVYTLSIMVREEKGAPSTSIKVRRSLNNYRGAYYKGPQMLEVILGAEE